MVEYQEKLPVRAVRQWNQLPRELVSASTLEAFKKNLDHHLADTVVPHFTIALHYDESALR